MGITFSQSRLGVLTTPVAALWSGTVTSYSTSGNAFTLVVATVTGGLANVLPGMAIDAAGTLVRIRTVNSGTNTLTLAENSVSATTGFGVGDTVYVYNVMYPMPRYGRNAENVTSITWSLPTPSQFSNWTFTGVSSEITDNNYVYYSWDGSKLDIYSDPDLENRVAKARRQGASTPLTLTISGTHSTLNGSVYCAGVVAEEGQIYIDPFIQYKDYNIAWTDLGASDNARSKAEQLPTPYITPQCAWVDTDTYATFDASGSFATYQTWGGAAATVDHCDWDGGADASYSSGTVGSSVAVKWSTAGFRYLKLTVTDSNTTTATRYIPVWVGITPYTSISRCDNLSWQSNEGYKCDLEFIVPPSGVLRHSLVCVVDMETKTPLFLGYIWPASYDYDFEKSSLTFTAFSAFAYLTHVYAYPFRLRGEKGDPTAWRFIDYNSYPREVYFLLNWHTNYLQLANCKWGTSVNDRLDYVRDYTAGTILEQLKKIAESGFMTIYGDRFGGLTAIDSLLYGSTITGAAYDAQTVTLANASLSEIVRYDYGTSIISTLRLSGWYINAAGDYKPIIITAPSKPGAWGRPSEITELISKQEDPFVSGYVEMLRCAGRHVGLTNAARTYTVNSFTDVDPGVSTARMVDIADGSRVVVESARLTYNPDAMSWSEQITGRTMGSTADSILGPIPASNPTPVIPVTPTPIPVPTPADFTPVVGFAMTPTQLARAGNFNTTAPNWVSCKPGGITGDMLNISLQQDGIGHRVFLFENTGNGVASKFGNVWRLNNGLSAVPSFSICYSDAQIKAALLALPGFTWNDPLWGFLFGGILSRDNVLRFSIQASVDRYLGVVKNNRFAFDFFSVDFGATWSIGWWTNPAGALIIYQPGGCVNRWDEWNGYRLGGGPGNAHGGIVDPYGAAVASAAGENTVPYYGIQLYPSWLIRLSDGSCHGVAGASANRWTSPDGGVTDWADTGETVAYTPGGQVTAADDYFYIRDDVSSEASRLYKNGVELCNSTYIWANNTVHMGKPYVYSQYANIFCIARRDTAPAGPAKYIVYTDDGGTNFDDKYGDFGTAIGAWAGDGGTLPWFSGRAMCLFFEDGLGVS